MDRTVKLLLNKVTQLTNRFNSLTQNSKKIHELPNAEFSGEVFIAVSDGTNTGKTIYKASEVSGEEFENLKNLDLFRPENTSILQVRDSEGNVLSSIDQSYLDGNKVSLAVNEETNALELLDFEGEPLSVVPLSSFVEAPKQKQIFIHDVTEIDLANPEQIVLNLETVPNEDEWYDLHINGGFVNDTSYQINENQLIIDRTKISYPITAGKKITFRYRRA